MYHLSYNVSPLSFGVMSTHVIYYKHYILNKLFCRLIRYANSCGSVFTYNIGFLLSIILYEITNDEKLKENLRFKDLPCEDSKKSERETLRE